MHPARSFLQLCGRRRILRVRLANLFPRGLLFDDEAQLRIALHSYELAPKRAKSEGIRKAPAAHFTNMAHPFSRPLLRPLIQKHNLCAINHISLHASDIQKFGHLRNPNHVVVRRPSNLNNGMILVMRDTVRTKGLPCAVQAVHVALAFGTVAMKFAGNEESRLKKRDKPWRPPNGGTHHVLLMVCCNKIQLVVVLDSQLALPERI